MGGGTGDEQEHVLIELELADAIFTEVGGREL